MMTEKTRKNRTMTGIITAGISALILMAAGFPAFAANYTQEQQAEGGTTTFDKYLVMPEYSTVPQAQFAFTITGDGNAKAYDLQENRFEILDGIVLSTDGVQTAPSITWTGAHPSGSESTVQFTPGDSTTSYSAATQAEKQMVKGFAQGTKFAKHTATVSFEGIRYPEPGVYRYKITETNPAQQGITYDENLTRYLDVYVEETGSGSLQVEGYILHSSLSDIHMGSSLGTDGAQDDNKSQGFTNRYQSYWLEFAKTVSGNQASHDKYFKFHVKIENAVDNTEYTVSLGDDENGETQDGSAQAAPAGNRATVYTDMVNPVSMKVSNGSAEADFYLQHGQKIVIRGIAAESKCTVTETAEDYKASYQLNGADAADGNQAVVETVSSNQVVAFTNTRSGVIPTGVIVTILPYAVVAMCAAAGIVLLRRRREEEE